MLLPLRAMTLLAVLCGAGGASAVVLQDDFEGHATGAFPSPPWLDAGDYAELPPVATLLSATVEDDFDAAGSPTQALWTKAETALVQGIYQPLPISGVYKLAADVRIDRFGNNPSDVDNDFAMQLAFAKLQSSFYTTPQAGPYLSNRNKRWHLFLISTDPTPIVHNIDLGVTASVGTWYRVEFDLKRITGAYRVKVVEIATQAVKVDSSGTFAGWTSQSGMFDSVAFFEGEHGTAVTLPNLPALDNVYVNAYTPAPAPGCGIGPELLLLTPLLGGVRRRGGS